MLVHKSRAPKLVTRRAPKSVRAKHSSNSSKDRTCIRKIDSCSIYRLSNLRGSAKQQYQREFNEQRTQIQGEQIYRFLAPSQPFSAVIRLTHQKNIINYEIFFRYGIDVINNTQSMENCSTSGLAPDEDSPVAKMAVVLDQTPWLMGLREAIPGTRRWVMCASRWTFRTRLEDLLKMRCLTSTIKQ